MSGFTRPGGCSCRRRRARLLSAPAVGTGTRTEQLAVLTRTSGASRVFRYRTRSRPLHGSALRSELSCPRACLTGAPAGGAGVGGARVHLGRFRYSSGPSYDDEGWSPGDVAAAGSRPVAPSADRGGSVRELRAAGHRGGEFCAPRWFRSGTRTGVPAGLLFALVAPKMFCFQKSHYMTNLASFASVIFFGNKDIFTRRQ